jgi:membrane-associated phospholipid phosphatase
VLYNKLLNINFNQKIWSVKWTLSLFFLGYSTLNAQQLRLQKGTEIGIYAGNIAWAGMNHFFIAPQNRSVQTFEIPFLDAYHKTQNDPVLKNVSDLSILLALMGSGLTGMSSDGNVHVAYQNVLLQNLLLTANLTQTVKFLTVRQRPSSWSESDDRYSFFSGHSSVSASAAATSLYYAYYIPGAPKHAKWVGWTTTGLSLLTGILRIESGKHYPSDVLIGWGVGTGVALLNLYLHRAP